MRPTALVFLPALGTDPLLFFDKPPATLFPAAPLSQRAVAQHLALIARVMGIHRGGAEVVAQAFGLLRNLTCADELDVSVRGPCRGWRCAGREAALNAATITSIACALLCIVHGAVHGGRVRVTVLAGVFRVW